MANESDHWQSRIHSRHNAAMNEILSALAAIGRPGSFCARQTAPGDDLRVRIKGLSSGSGELKWPVSNRAAKALIKLARPARFGWKDQTLLDRTVRDAWEIPKSRIKIDNRAWNRVLNPLLEEFRSRLGLPAGSRLRAHLHNLLMYETGQFFRPHQDSEKLDGMVATLVVLLPSHYRGGTLIVDHHGDTKRFQAARLVRDRLTLIAFYADCHHQVKPVTEGYRVALTYNLVLENAGSQTVFPAFDAGSREGLGKGLRQYFSAAGDGNSNASEPERASNACRRPRKWVYLLDYQYTRKGLGWRRLKHEDQARVDALIAVAGSLDLEAHLALAEIQESWDCVEAFEDWDDSYSHRGYWQTFDDEDEEDEEDEDAASDADDYILQDLIDRNIALKHCIDINGRRFDCAGLYLDGDELCWTKATDEFDPFASEYEGYMGNYGNTLERWYHRAALILWRGRDHDAVMCEIDPRAVVRDLLKQAGKEATLAQARERVRGIEPFWGQFVSGNSDARLAGAAFKLALRIRSAELARALLLPLGLNALLPGTAKTLVEIERSYGTAWCLKLLRSWSKPARSGYAFVSTDEILSRFSGIVASLAVDTESPCGLTGWLIDHQFKAIKQGDTHTGQHSTPLAIDRQEPARVKDIIDLLTACRHAGDRSRHQGVLDYAMRTPALYSKAALADMLRHLSKAVAGAAFNERGYAALLDKTLQRFEARVNQGERKPGDWTIERTSTCTCGDCRELNRFLQLHSRNTLAWPIKKERRRHIHTIIDGMGIPVTHVTQRQGSPFTLVLTKTKRLFELDRKALQEAGKTLAELRKIAARRRG